ncbi:MAG TPA: cyclodeaminase/cyclohydrolase family protein, partial [Gemmatimonadales bacterium]|nr:cyclodeaminase/cyclohydrolase family protein [Gemmatimonadales bacterium]
AYHSFDLIRTMAEKGNPASASDAGVGALCARAAVRGAWLNVRTNASGMKDKSAIANVLADGVKLDAAAARLEAEILEIVERKFG